MNIKALKILTSFILLTTFSLLANNTTLHTTKTTLQQPKNYVQDGYNLSRENQEAGTAHFNEGIKYYKQKKDTAAYLDCYIGLSEIAKRNGDFNHSFDLLWNILQQAKGIRNKSPLVQVHRKIGVLYGIYGKDSLALSYLISSLSLVKEHLGTEYLPSSYLPIANYYVEQHKYDNALLYLDSCYSSSPTKGRLNYIDAMYGHIYTQKGNFPKAQKYLKDLIPLFQKDNLAFLAMVYYYYGDLACEMKERNNAIFYFEKSLETINTMTVHIEIKPVVLERLAHLYRENDDLQQAFERMESAKLISDSLFHTQSIHNKALFEIKNKYQEDLSKKVAQVEAQQHLLKLKDKASFRLKLLIVIFFVMASIAMLALRQRFRMKQMMVNKAKNDTIISLRNKELTSNALQVIEKEKSVNDLLEIIKENMPTKYKGISKQFKQNNAKMWTDFHLRFTQTNDTFYNQILEMHPTLTPTDLKHCALIKLKFDSKEMSHILGISLNSVHMARYRVRKKLNLKRDKSLSNYIARI